MSEQPQAVEKRTVRYQVRMRNYENHPGQTALWFAKQKRIVIRAGRRGGKTVGSAMIAVKSFLAGKRVLYAAPTIDQVAKFWKECKRMLAEPIDYGAYYKNETEHIIEKRGTEARIRAKTAWNAETLRGDYADVLILDEWQLMDETAWTEVGAPMLIDNNGSVIFIYTPPSLESRSTSKARDPHHAAKMWKEVKEDPAWLCIHFPSSVNPHISREGILEASKNMSALAFRQEIMAEDTEEIPGALWTRKIIEDSRFIVTQGNQLPELRRVVIGIDPSGGNTTEVGMVASAEGMDGQYYILRDITIKAARPREWAQRAINNYYEMQADRVIAEDNYGGQMVEETLRNVDENVSFSNVHATRGKLIRAEPILALFQQKRMHLVCQCGQNPCMEFANLEEEMCVTGDTLVTTRYGDIPITAINVGDLVRTRNGFRPVKQKYDNGFNPTIRIQAGIHALECTPNHPIFIVGKGFVRADNVSRGDRVLIWHTPSYARIEHSKAKDIFSTTMDITRQAVRAAVNFCIEKNGRRFAVPFLEDLTSTIKTGIARIIESATYSLLVGVCIVELTGRAVALLGRHPVNAQTAKQHGQDAKNDGVFAASAANGSDPKVSIHGIANYDVNTTLETVKDVKRQGVKRVFNLSVDQDEEYFANGILTHNCSYTAGPGERSPNRLDAMVWTGIELSGMGQLGLLDLIRSGRMEQLANRAPSEASTVREAMNSRGPAVTRTETPASLAAVETNDHTPKCEKCGWKILQSMPDRSMRCSNCGHQQWPAGFGPPGPAVGFMNLSKREIRLK